MLKRGRSQRYTLSAPEPVGEDRIPARLMSIAGEHIRRFGLSRLTVVAVAEEAGMSHANVYRYFASKAALVEAVVTLWLRQLELALMDITNAPDPADDKLERFLLAWGRAHRDKLEQDPALYSALVQTFGKGRGLVSAHRTRLRNLVGRIVDEGSEAGPFRVRSEEAAVGYVMDAMPRFAHPYLVQEARDLPRPQYDQRLSVSARVIVRALVIGSVQ